MSTFVGSRSSLVNQGRSPNRNNCKLFNFADARTDLGNHALMSMSIHILVASEHVPGVIPDCLGVAKLAAY